MGLTGTLLRSRAVAALTSPHGVDRYLEQVNPMWAAHEVRARIVDVVRAVVVGPEAHEALLVVVAQQQHDLLATQVADGVGDLALEVIGVEAVRRQQELLQRPGQPDQVLVRYRHAPLPGLHDVAVMAPTYPAGPIGDRQTFRLTRSLCPLPSW